MVPQLSARGLLPAGVHDCDLDEIEAMFCVNDHREALWASFGRFLRWMTGKPKVQFLYVDGSFTTDKPLPGDIDVIVDLSGAAQNDIITWAQIWAREHDLIKQLHRADFHLSRAGQKEGMVEFFQRVGIKDGMSRGIAPATRKGILRVAI